MNKYYNLFKVTCVSTGPSRTRLEQIYIVADNFDNAVEIVLKDLGATNYYVENIELIASSNKYVCGSLYVMESK